VQPPDLHVVISGHPVLVVLAGGASLRLIFLILIRLHLPSLPGTQLFLVVLAVSVSLWRSLLIFMSSPLLRSGAQLFLLVLARGASFSRSGLIFIATSSWRL
jgi:hypothetical protein